MFIGCEKNKEVINVNNKIDLYIELGIIPLNVGNHWEYKTINYDSSGKVISQTKDTKDVNFKTIIDNTTYFHVSDFGINYYATNTFKGYEVLNFGLLYKYPVV